MTKSEARRVAREALKAGHHHPTICEDVESGEVYVRTNNRAWMPRTYETLGAWLDDKRY